MDYENKFIWCDLSTFEIERAVAFYQSVFAWQFHSLEGGATEDYSLFYAGENSSAGIFTMPEYLQKINMPSFWMSYVAVSDLERSLALALELGAKCEIEPTAFDSDSRFALIRDPLGAGFTIYQGPDLRGRDESSTPGRMCWNELQVSSLDVVQQFYQKLFDWNFEPDPSSDGRYFIYSSSGEVIATLLELDDIQRDSKNYWIIYFAVENIDATLEQIKSRGGAVFIAPSQDVGRFALVADDQNAFFCVCEPSANPYSVSMME